MIFRRATPALGPLEGLPPSLLPPRPWLGGSLPFPAVRGTCGRISQRAGCRRRRLGTQLPAARCTLHRRASRRDSRRGTWGISLAYSTSWLGRTRLRRAFLVRAQNRWTGSGINTERPPKAMPPPQTRCDKKPVPGATSHIREWKGNPRHRPIERTNQPAPMDVSVRC